MSNRYTYDKRRAARLICEASRALGLLKGVRAEFPQTAFLDRDIAEIEAEIARALDAYPDDLSPPLSDEGTKE